MEQNYIVATASTADRTREYLEEHKIPFISYNYVLGDESFEDDCLDSTRDEVYKKMFYGLGDVISKEHQQIIKAAIDYRYEKLLNGGIIL